jgi:hypothetical protein
MYTIRLDFQRFIDLDLRALIGAIGIYVIWDGRAKARPTYIGEGTILRRFAQHVTRDERRFAYPWDGYVGVLSGSTPGVHKDEARVAERVLLDVAFHCDRLPPANQHPGNSAIVCDFCRSQTLQLVVSGYDPFAAPKTARLLSRTKRIKVRSTALGGYEVQADWQLRRLRQAIA